MASLLLFQRSIFGIYIIRNNGSKFISARVLCLHIGILHSGRFFGVCLDQGINSNLFCGSLV